MPTTTIHDAQELIRRLQRRDLMERINALRWRRFTVLSTNESDYFERLNLGDVLRLEDRDRERLRFLATTPACTSEDAAAVMTLAAGLPEHDYRRVMADLAQSALPASVASAMLERIPHAHTPTAALDLIFEMQERGRPAGGPVPLEETLDEVADSA